MSSNYPPGVSGNEPQIQGDLTWETWAENLKPGDPCEVTWKGSVWPARFVACTDDGDCHLEVETGVGHYTPAVVPWDDVEPPEVSNAE